MNEIDKSETKRRITVMQGFLDGKILQIRDRLGGEPWRDYAANLEPEWDWVGCNYRIKPLEFPKLPEGLEYFNPSGVTANDVGEGYRPLVLGELIPSGAEYWGDNGWAKTVNTPGCVSVNSFTYRTSISTPFPEPPKPKVMVPLQAADIPPGSVVAPAQWYDYKRWMMVLVAGFSGVDLMSQGDDNYVTYEKLYHDGWKIKRPGQDWQPCEKESES